MDIYNKTLPIFCDSIQTQYSTAKDILKPFGVSVKPIDKKMTIPVAPAKESVLTKLGLPTFTYEQMLTNIIEEIKNRESFKL